jgi:hypothetical protein
METMRERVDRDLMSMQANIIAAENTPQIKEEAPEVAKTPQPQ